MERREFLKRVGVAGGAGAAGVASIAAYDQFVGPPEDLTNETGPVPPERQPPLAEQFDTVVDAVGAGADPTGDESINGLVEEYANDDTLLSFRPGTYQLEQINVSNVTNFGIASSQGGRPTFLPAGGNCEPREPYLLFEGVDDILLDGLDFDFRGSGPGMAVEMMADGDATVRNVRLVGNCPRQLAMLRVDVRDANGHALLEGLEARNSNGNGTLTGLYVGKYHAGEVTFRNCNVEGFPDNGLYASSPGHPGGENGVVRVIEGTFANNNIANVRLGTTDSVARGVTVTVESPPSLDGEMNARGIRLREKSGQTIENADVTIGADVDGSFGGVVFHPNAGGALVKDSTISIDADGIPGINALFPSDQSFDGPVFDGVTLRGNASRGYAATIKGRNGTVFRNCTIDQSGAGRGGILIENAEECTIVDSVIRTDGFPIDLDNADVHVQNTTVDTSSGSRTIEDMHARDEVVTA